MATLTLFWTPEESAPWLSQMAAAYELRFLVFPPVPNYRTPVERTPPLTPDDVANAFDIYFAPATDPHFSQVKTYRDVNMRGWGWGRVHGGRRSEEPLPLLEKTEVVGEAKTGVPLKLDKCVTWLKRRIEKDAGFKKGVRVTWTHLPGKTRIEESYFYSQGALDELQKGVVWVHDAGTSMIRFAPK